MKRILLITTLITSSFSFANKRQLKTICYSHSGITNKSLGSYPSIQSAMKRCQDRLDNLRQLSTDEVLFYGKCYNAGITECGDDSRDRYIMMEPNVVILD